MKYDFGKWASTLSAFDIKSPTLLENSATKIYSPNGEVRHRGLEWNVFGEPRKGTRLMGGLMFLDATYRNTEGGLYDATASPRRRAGMPSWALSRILLRFRA